MDDEESSLATILWAGSHSSMGYFFFHAALMSSSIWAWVSISFLSTMEVARERRGLNAEPDEESGEWWSAWWLKYIGWSCS